MSFAESVVTDNIGQSQLNKGQSEYDAGSSRLDAARAQYAEGQSKLEQGKADYAAGEQQLADARAQHAEGEARLEKIKPIYSAVQPAYQKYFDMKAEYDRAAENGDLTKAALLWPGVEAQKRLYESRLVGTGYSIEAIVLEYEEGQRQLSAGAQQIAAAEQQLADAKLRLEEGQRQLDEAAAQIAAGQAELDKAGQQLAEGRATFSANRSQLAEDLSTLEQYGDELERLEHGVSALMHDDEVASRVGDGASYADICSVAAEHYGNDIDRAERERAIGSVIDLLVFTSAVIVAVCALLHDRQRTWTSVLAAVSAMVSGGCAVGAAALGMSAIIAVESIALMLFSMLYIEVFVKIERSNHHE